MADGPAAGLRRGHDGVDLGAVEGHLFEGERSRGTGLPQYSYGGLGVGTGDLEHLAAHLGLFEAGRGVEGQELALADKAHPLAELGLVHVVGGDQDGHALAGHVVDELPELAAADGVDAGGRFVEKEHARPVDDGTAQPQPLPPATGEVCGELVLAAHQPGHAQDLGLAPAQIRAREPIDLAVEADVLAGGQVLVEREKLRHVAHVCLHGLGLGGRVVAQHATAACARLEQAQQHADGRRLAGTIGAQPAVDFAAAHGKADVIHGDEVAKALGQAFDHDGRVVKAGVTLKALRPPDQQLSWLKDAIRRFRRDYYLGSERVRNLALDGLRTLVVDKAFGASGWRVESEREATAISFNRGVLVRGCFPSMSRQFPDRLVHCRLLGPGEAVRDTPPEHDLLIDFVMHLPLQASPERQRRDPGRLTWLAPNYARVELNVLHSDPEAEYVDLNPGFQDIVAPYEVNPLLTLSLYASLSRSMSAGQIPGSEESTLRDLFLPALLSAALRDLFGPELGRTATPPVTSAEAKFVESLVVMLCERTYGDAYVTLMVGPQWQLALRQYRSALGRIDHPLIRRGQERYLSTKTQLAELLGRSNAALDNFIQMFPQLITVDEPFRGNNQGAVRFTLHPLEHSIYRLIESGERKLRLNPRSRAAETVPILPVNQVFKSLMPLGYRQTEIDAALELLEARQMIQRDLDHGLLIGWEPDVPTVDEVRDSLQAVQARLTRLRPLLDSAFASSLERNLRPYLALAPKQPLAPHQLINANRLVERVSVELSAAVASRRESLRSGASQLADLAGDTSSRSDSLLSQAAVGGLFVDHLNAVRVGLLREMNELKGAEERMRRNAREVRDLLGQSTLADDELIMAFGRLEAARRELEQTRRQREVLGGRVSSYREAARLLGEATALLNERLLPLGAAVAQQRDDLDRWARDIREALAIRRTEALQEVEPWRSRFQGIKQQVDAFENAQRDAFAERQQFLRGLLVDLLKVKAETLGPALTYNPVSPAESYRLLEEQVCDLLGGLLQNAGNRLKEIAHSARNLAADETLRLLPEEERSHAAQDMDGVARTAMSLFDSVRVEFAGLINLVAGGKDVALDEIEAQAKKVQQFREPVADLFTRIQSYKAAIRSVPLTLSEERANALLIRLSARGEVDFRDFEEAAARELAAEDAWDLLKGLVRKSRAQVRIQAVRL